MKYHIRCPNRLCLLGIFLCSWMVAQAQTATEAWVRRYNSEVVGSHDYALKIVTDTAGNAIVAGYTDDGFTGRDILVIKYSGAGVPLWTNRYNGPHNGNEQANAVAVDGSGNVFVAGNSTVLGYSNSGMALWTNRYGGEASALAADSNGNVFVTGTGPSVSSGGTWDYMTVAYSGTGVALWTNRYNGPAGSSDDARALAVDNQGHVFVTGHPATVGYSGTGVPLWTNRFSGWANAVAADSNGNVFVTGIADTPQSNLDYQTVAYSGAGVPLWTNRYGGPGRSSDYATGVALDGSGNVFVTGYSVAVGLADCATIAYSGAGVALWTNRYGGVFRALAVDSNGNVFVTGSAYTPELSYNYETVAYSGAGAALWTNRYRGSPLDSGASAVAVDSSGNVFVTACSIGGGGDPDGAIIAYSGAGAVLWTNHYNGPGNGNDQASAMALSGSGTVFVTGSSPGVGGFADYVTIAYSEAGVPLWTNRYNGLGNGNYPRAVAVDSGGNVFVTGFSYRSGFNPGNDYATIAYSGAGVALWTNRYNGPGDGDDQASAVAVDNSGRVFVTGYSTGSGNSFDYATIAYAGSGVPLWTNRYNSPENGNDQAKAVVVDGSGNVFVAGNPVVIGYSGTGVPHWTNLYGGVASALAVDSSGNVFVTWASSGDYATVAYSGAGVPRWTNRYDGPDNSIDVAQDLAVDGNGNVFVTGHSYSYGEGFDYATVAYSGAGVPLWTNHYNGPDNSLDNATAVAVDGSGNVFVTGSSANTNGNSYSADYATIAYSGAGMALWTNRYKLARLEGEPPTASLAVGRDGALYLTGSSLPTTTAGSFDYTTVKYVWRNQLVIQPFTAGASTVNLMLSGNPNSSWTVQRALTATGPWTNLGPSLIGANGLGIFSDTNPPAQRAFYRITQP